MQATRNSKLSANKDFLRSQSVVRRRRERKVRRLLFRLVLLIILLASLVSVTWLPQFAIDKVVVAGTSDETAKSIQREVEDDIRQTYFGIIPRSNFLLYPRSSIKENILKTHLEFESINVGIENIHILNIRVVERKPVALWCVNEECSMIDERAYVYSKSEVASSTSSSLLHIYDKSASSTIPFGKEALAPENFKAMLSVISMLQTSKLPVESVSIEVGGQYVFKIVDNGRLIFSDKKPFEQSYQDLVSALKSPVFATSSKFQYIDVRFGNKVFYRLGKDNSGSLATTSTSTKER